MGPQKLTTWVAGQSKFVLEHDYQLYTPDNLSSDI